MAAQHISSSIVRSPTIQIGGHAACLDKSGAVYFPELEMLVVSDLHFEKGTSIARSGQLLPPFDTAETLTRLERLVRLYTPKMVISLGDAFHDIQAESRMDADDAMRLSELCNGVEWHWVLGNHDPYPPQRFAGTSHVTLEIAGLLMVHEPGEQTGWSLAGHLHPCAAVSQDGCRLRRPAFICEDNHMVLPALGAYTGGLNVMDDAFAPFFGADAQVYISGRERVYAVPRHALRADQQGWARTMHVLR